MKWFHNFKVGTKLFIFGTVMCLLILLSNGIGIYDLNKVNDNVDVMYNWMLVPIMNIDAASNALVQIGVCVSDINETENLNSAKNNELEDNAISLLDTVIATTEEYNSTYLLSDDPATVKTLTSMG